MVLAYLAVVRGIPRGIGYATKLLQSGVDLKTVQKLLGPQKLESTMRPPPGWQELPRDQLGLTTMMAT